MKSDTERFEVGDRVLYLAFKMAEYGTITEVSVEISSDSSEGTDIRLYTIAMDNGGIVRSLSHDLLRVT